MGIRRARTRDDLVAAVENMIIYEKDCDVIQKLLKVDSRFFVRVLEEIIDGELFFSDFDSLISNSKYRDVLENNLQAQKALAEEIAMFMISKEKYDEAALFSTGIVGNLGVHFNTISDEKMKEFAATEIQENHEQLLQSILLESAEDDFKTRETKLALLRLLETGAIDKNAVLFFAKTETLPIDYRYQVLNDFDRMYMAEHDLSEDAMKKIKAYTMFMRASTAAAGGGEEDVE